MWPLEKISNWQSGEKYRVEQEEFFRSAKEFLFRVKQCHENAIHDLDEKIQISCELRAELDRHIEKMQNDREKLLGLIKSLDDSLKEANE